jgi:predicted NAD/FAD-dependent oxidoreductase
MSGLTAARNLQAAGFDVRVFEKSRGCGGRMATRRASGYEFDHGAQFFTVRDQRFRDVVNTWVSEKVADRWGGRFATLDGNRRDLHKDDPIRYVGIPRMSSVARHLAKGMAVEFETTVLRLDRANSHWKVTTNQGTVPIAFDAVVLAVPPDQAVSILGSGDEFLPGLDEVSMLPCWAVMVAFKKPLGLPFDAAFVHESPLSWVARNSSKPWRKIGECWILHGSPEWSSHHFDAEADWISESLLSAFFKATGNEACAPTWVKTHRWRYALAANPISEECLWDPKKGVGVCGDWCHGSRVEGAFLSGEALASRILESVEE